ncbi:MAG TPA: hypothetical protein VGJ26_14025 [Pirellulales bacterium]|jgi:hypothetical protein
MALQRFQFSLLSILAWTATIAVWSATVPWIAKSPDGSRHEKGYPFTILVLLGMTAALAYILRNRRKGLLIAALLAAIIGFSIALIIGQ